VVTRPLVAVVDDDLVYTEMVRDLLDSEGYDTILLQQAATAVEAIVRARPMLVVLDVRMDVADAGVSILTALRANPQTSALPVIVCTADQQFLRSEASFLRSQNAAVVAKPFDLDDFLDAINRSLIR
jgi:CheY-like chemotaxis protein